MLLIQKAPTSRQQPSEQTKTLPGSNFSEKGRQPRKNFDIPRSSVVEQYLQQPTQTSEVEEERDLSARYANLQQQIRMQNKKVFRCLPNHIYSGDQNSDTEPEVKSVVSYVNIKNSTSESDLQISEETMSSPDSIEEELEQLTNDFALRFKTQVSEVLTKWKSQEKLVPKISKKVITNGAGDVRTPSIGTVHKKIDLVRNDCYRKIEANLNLLKTIDNVTKDILKNRLDE